MIPQLDGELAGGRLIKRVPSRFSEAEVTEYLAFIDYPNAANISPATFDASLENLALVVHKQLLHLPFSNLDVHYTPWHAVVIDPRDYYERHVKKTGRRFGDLCFAATGLLLEMLRGLGYRAYPGGGRINLAPDGQSPRFGTLQHEVVFVQLGATSSATYLVDVSYGVGGLTRPLLLSTAPSNVVPGAAPPEYHRLSRAPNPESSLEGVTDWRLDVKCGKLYGGGWRTVYSFTEEEFYYPDFDVWMYAYSTRKGGSSPFWTHNPFMQYLMVVRSFPLDDMVHPTAKGSQQRHHPVGNNGSFTNSSSPIHSNSSLSYSLSPMGRLFLFHDRITRHIGDQVDVVRTLKDEAERVEALRELFGIEVGEEAARCVRPVARLGKL